MTSSIATSVCLHELKHRKQKLPGLDQPDQDSSLTRALSPKTRRVTNWKNVALALHRWWLRAWGFCLPEPIELPEDPRLATSFSFSGPYLEEPSTTVADSFEYSPCKQGDVSRATDLHRPVRTPSLYPLADSSLTGLACCPNSDTLLIWSRSVWLPSRYLTGSSADRSPELGWDREPSVSLLPLIHNNSRLLASAAELG